MTTGRRKRHNPEQVVRKLRDADAMLNAGKDLAAVLQALEVSESTYARWRSQYGGTKAEETRSARGDDRESIDNLRKEKLLANTAWYGAAVAALEDQRAA